MPRCVEEFSILDNGVRPAYILTTPHGSNTNHSTAPADSQQQPLLLASYLEIEILEMVNILNIVKLRKQVKVATTTKLILGTHSKNHGYIYNLLGSIAIRARVGANKDITFSQDPEESFVWHDSRGSSASHKLLPLKEVVHLLLANVQQGLDTICSNANELLLACQYWYHANSICGVCSVLQY